MNCRPGLALLLLCPICVFGQKGGSGSQRPTGTNDKTLYNNTGTELSTLVVYGSVALPNGASPGQLVTVERVCGGSPQTAGFADSKGRFSFDLGVLNRAPRGTSAIDSVSSSQLAGNTTTPDKVARCVVRASLSGYHSETLPLAPVADGQKTALGTIVLKSFGNEEAAALSATDSAIPKNAKKDYDKGLDAAAKAKWQEAIDSLQKATAGYPRYASAWLSLGMLQAGSGNAAAALQSFMQAIAADEKFSLPYIEAALLESLAGDWQKTVLYSEKAIALAPNSFPRAYLLSATAYLNLRKLDEAENSAAAGLKLDGDHQYPDLEYIVGIALMGKKHDADARQHLKSYLALAPNGVNAAAATQSLARLHE